MLFGVDFCRRRAHIRRRPAFGYANMKLAAAVFAALLFFALLIIAPQWLLVLLVAVLSAAVLYLISCPAK